MQEIILYLQCTVMLYLIHSNILILNKIEHNIEYQKYLIFLNFFFIPHQ